METLTQTVYAVYDSKNFWRYSSSNEDRAKNALKDFPGGHIEKREQTIYF